MADVDVCRLYFESELNTSAITGTKRTRVYLTLLYESQTSSSDPSLVASKKERHRLIQNSLYIGENAKVMRA